MIIEFIITLFTTAFGFVLDLLPSVDITLPTGFITWLIDLFSMVAYFLPLPDFLAMMGIWFFVVNFEIIWRFIQRIWDALPLT